MKHIFGLSKQPVTQAGILEKADLRKLEVMTGSADINVFIHDKPFIDIVLDTYENGPQLNIRHDRDTAVIETIGGTGPRFFAFNHPPECLQIKVPMNVAEEWYIKSGSGDVDIPKMLTNSFHIKVGSGDVDLSSLKAKEATLIASSGDMMIHDVVTDTLQVSTTSGDTLLRKVKSNHVTGTSTSGEIEIMDIYSEKLIVKVTSGDISITDAQVEIVDLACTSGDVEAENVKASKAFLRATSGDVDYTYVDDCTIHGTVTSGDMNIICRNKQPNASIILRTSSGDVHTNVREHIHQQSDRYISGVIGKGEYTIQLESSSGDIDLLYR